jgi:hypothetical protein
MEDQELQWRETGEEFEDEEEEDIDTSQVMLLFLPMLSKSLGKLCMIFTLRQLFLRYKDSL